MSREIKKEYPVFFSGSDTSGEKPYEEFFTEQENVYLKRHLALGVVYEPRPQGNIGSRGFDPKV